MIFDILIDVITDFWGVCIMYLQKVGGYFGIPLMSLAVVAFVAHWFFILLPAMGNGLNAKTSEVSKNQARKKGK